MNHQQTELDCRGKPVTTGAGNILEAARAVLTITKNARNLIAANEEDPTAGYDSIRNRAFVPYTEL